MAYGRREAVKAKRVRQLRRRISLFVCCVMMAVLAFGIYKVKTLKDAEKEAAKKETVMVTEEAEKPLEPEKVTEPEIPEEPVETEEERLERVKKEAKEKGYPKDVIELLSKNPETVDFVENYEKNKDRTPANIISEFEEGKIPHILQWDERWGYFSYGTSNIAVCGCGPTCLSMVFSALTGDFSITPDKLAVYGMEHDYINEENDTRWAFMTEAGDDWGIKCREEILDEKSLFKEIEKGHPVVCSVGPGPFTDKGHFIVLAGIEDGKLIVNDPFSIKNSTRRWEYKEFEDQIKTMWIYSKKK